MTREEIKKILMIIDATYPNFKVTDATVTIDAWHMFLDDYSYDDISNALIAYTKSSNSGFAPSVSQLIEMAEKPKELAEIGDNEAWSIVRKAISNGIYNSKTEFEKFSPEIKKAVGSHEQIKIWAMDNEYNEGVVMSQFLRAYRTVKERNRDYQRMPAAMKIATHMAIQGIEDHESTFNN